MVETGGIRLNSLNLLDTGLKWNDNESLEAEGHSPDFSVHSLVFYCLEE